MTETREKTVLVLIAFIVYYTVAIILIECSLFTNIYSHNMNSEDNLYAVHEFSINIVAFTR